MKPSTRVADWWKYGRLSAYPVLSPLERDAALKRVKAHEREARRACQPWFAIGVAGSIAFVIAWYALASGSAVLARFSMLSCIPLVIVSCLFQRRIKWYVTMKLEAEENGGRLARCIECDFDLRAS